MMRSKSWIQVLSNPTNTQSWPPLNQNVTFDWSQPTNQVYASQDDEEEKTFTEPFSLARSLLDYSYHANPLKNRQLLQDEILRRVVESAPCSTATDSSPSSTKHQQRPWMVFTAGPMGVGKGYVLQELHKANLFPIQEFIKIDPDLLKSELPELPGYIQINPVIAASQLHRESTQMADVLLEHALAHSHSILVDGSLRDVEYYTSFLKRIRREFPTYQIAILQIVASREVIFQRAKTRGEKTGRVVPIELLEESIRQVPASVAQLSSLTDVVYTIENNEGQPLKLVNSHSKDESSSSTTVPSWSDFAQSWKQEQEQPQTSYGDTFTTNDTTNTTNTTNIISQMKNMFECRRSHELANQIWKKSYPNFCARCSLSCDKQCGICIHRRHLCSCPECNGIKSCERNNTN